MPMLPVSVLLPARVRAETSGRAITQPWTEAEPLAAGPPSLQNAADWKVHELKLHTK